MALAKSTLSAAVGAGDTSILVASLTGLAVGSVVKIDQEYMKVVSVPASATLPVPVYRGQDGTKQVAHAITANVVHSSTPGIDFGGPAAGAPAIVSAPTSRNRVLVSLSATGAIPNPTPGTDLTVVLNGTAAITGTMANPSKDNDGDELTVVGNGKAAHILNYTGGVGAGGAALDVLTFAAGAQIAIKFVAANEIWVPLGVYAGTLTNVTITAS